ncbi:MAG: formylglycine-generating enzyme family protein [Planctomycetota bacterium]
MIAILLRFLGGVFHARCSTPRWRQGYVAGFLIALPVLTLADATEHQESNGIAFMNGNEDPDLGSLLKTFLDEFVLLAPGKEPFPTEFDFGVPGKSERVTVSDPFRIAKHEIPQNLYQAVMGSNPSRWQGPRNAVEMVDWNEANRFCAKVTELLRARQWIRETEEVRLPTEREWEYACRAGSKTAYSFGAEPDVLGDYAWFTGNAAGNDPPVGAKKPNAWGLCDMHGYVWEWCAGKEESMTKPLRGGAWTSEAKDCRSDSVRMVPLATRGPDIGFRCVLANR